MKHRKPIHERFNFTNQSPLRVRDRPAFFLIA